MIRFIALRLFFRLLHRIVRECVSEWASSNVRFSSHSASPRRFPTKKRLLLLLRRLFPFFPNTQWSVGRLKVTSRRLPRLLRFARLDSRRRRLRRLRAKQGGLLNLYLVRSFVRWPLKKIPTSEMKLCSVLQQPAEPCHFSSIHPFIRRQPTQDEERRKDPLNEPSNPASFT